MSATGVLFLAISAASLLVAVWLVVRILRDRPVHDALLYALGVLEAGLVLQLVWGVVQVVGAHGDLNVAAYLGYLVGALVILPIGFLWAAAEQNRSGTAVLLVATIAVPVLELRLHDLWVTR
ncbi:hypothetical protein GCM10011519_34380 [Marmoricola endophyticus]|uniref:Uncharacterized protein n=1 Tax=Marmoricola endophyticus TaxID=2040280 RepID=A0A917F9E8_9ACTN|nr:hypothetical protein [Marmoricola endophyticus]GGF57558.1 hypothetical protein GCM10011519_34380 [Marmoricola endophyticus]